MESYCHCYQSSLVPCAGIWHQEGLNRHFERSPLSDASFFPSLLSRGEPRRGSFSLSQGNVHTQSTHAKCFVWIRFKPTSLAHAHPTPPVSSHASPHWPLPPPLRPRFHPVCLQTLFPLFRTRMPSSPSPVGKLESRVEVCPLPTHHMGMSSPNPQCLRTWARVTAVVISSDEIILEEGGPSSLMTDVLMNREDLDRDTHMKRTLHEDEDTEEGENSKNQDCHQKLGRSLQQTLPSQSPEGTSSADAFSDF